MRSVSVSLVCDTAIKPWMWEVPNVERGRLGTGWEQACRGVKSVTVIYVCGVPLYVCGLLTLIGFG